MASLASSTCGSSSSEETSQELLSRLSSSAQRVHQQGGVQQHRGHQQRGQGEEHDVMERKCTLDELAVLSSQLLDLELSWRRSQRELRVALGQKDRVIREQANVINFLVNKLNDKGDFEHLCKMAFSKKPSCRPSKGNMVTSILVKGPEPLMAKDFNKDNDVDNKLDDDTEKKKKKKIDCEVNKSDEPNDLHHCKGERTELGQRHLMSTDNSTPRSSKFDQDHL